MSYLNRRKFLQTTLGTAAASSISAGLGHTPALRSEEKNEDREVLPVAAVVTVYRRNSHADVILGKILDGYEQQGGAGPRLKLVSLVTDQVPAGDISRAKAAEHGFQICASVEEALTLGGKRLAVAGVISIGEHGDYPSHEITRQHMYPRRQFFDSIADVFQKYGEVRPLFNDKHLAWNWKDARHMYDRAAAMKIPFLAGSSVPVAWRIPGLQLDRNCQIKEALAIGYGGMESYGFHALEGLQCLVERRRGGETGVKRIDVVTGDGIAQAEKEGRWSRQLLEAAVATTPEKRRSNRGIDPKAQFCLIEYNDGLRATLAMNTRLVPEFACAVQLEGRRDPLATWFQLQEGRPYYHFAYLVKAIDEMIHTGKPPYPIERTLLTTGILDAAMNCAVHAQGRETPHLNIAYEATDWPYATGVAPEPRMD